MNQPKVTILIRAYNAEKYIAKAIESVLGQTQGNFELFIRNNGSTDKTGDIIQKYARKDKRILYLKNKVNWVLDEGGNIWWPKFNGEYVAILDADDYLDVRFIEVMYNAAKEHNADLVVSGTTMFLEEDPKQKSVHIPPQIATKNSKDLEPLFIDLYSTLRTVWGKLYKTEFYYENYQFAFGCPIQGCSLDTYSVLGYLQKCRSFVSVHMSLHYYCVRNSSSYRDSKVSLTRIEEANLLFLRGKECLQALDIFSQRNSDSLYLFHNSSINDLLNLCLNSVIMSVAEKIRCFESVLNDELFSFYSLNSQMKNQTLELFMKYIKTICSSDSEIYLAGKESFLARLYFCFDEINNNKVNLLTLPRLLLVLSDSNNKNLLGIDYLALKWQTKSHSIQTFSDLNRDDKLCVLKDKNRIREVFSQSNNQADYDLKITEIDELISNNQFEEALDILNQLSGDYPLSKECLLYRIYLSFQFGDIGLAVDSCNIALFFWNDDQNIKDISKNLFNEINNQTGDQ